MSSIKILPEILSNKIAAGEVVERPSSIVKELVENALDANSSIIVIEIEQGGRSLIRVSDNGIGMNHDDALLSLERYGTSKIFTDQDLFSIGTLGFRGEALPSIASISKFFLVTCDKTTRVGTKIYLEGGKIKKVSETGAPVGTMITVKSIFFNTPARRKFLKSVNTEMGHIADTVASMALGWPDVQFKLYHNSNIVKSWPAAIDPLDRVVDVLGKNIKNDLYKIDHESNSISINGWISSSRITRTTSRGIYIYVNGRFVRDRILQHALFEGYRGRLIKGQFPVAVIFIKVAFDQVDVNVHPTKHTVRFAEQKKVHGTVAEAVSSAIDNAENKIWDQVKTSGNNQPVISEPVFKYNQALNNQPLQKEYFVSETSAVYNQLKQENRPLFEKKEDKIKFNQSLHQASIWDKKRFGNLRVIGQLHDTYIICESNEGLVIIDQHAAHERILFEQLKSRSTDSVKASQKLLIPETIDLGYQEADILKRLLPDLNDFGLEIEHFGENTFIIKSVPAIFKNRNIKPLIIEIVEKMANVGFSPGLESTIDQCLILMACHGAIRANQHLSDKQIYGLLDQLDKSSQPSYCPHGRPTWIRWTKASLEKSFKRIV